MLKIQNAVKTFTQGKDVRNALNHISLELNKGDFVTVIGSNGAGKSTLFNAIGGSFFLDQGQVFMEDKDITFMKEHRRARLIGRIFQDPLRGTAPNMTIEENLALAYFRSTLQRASFGITHKDRLFFQEKLAELGIGLENRLKAKVGSLSGGQRQSLSLLMATIVPPKLLLLDEHCAALDPSAAEKVMELTQRIVQKEGITCMMITHNIQSALDTGNRTIMMDEGSIILDTSGEERTQLTVPKLLEIFKSTNKKEWNDDRILLA